MYSVLVTPPAAEPVTLAEAKAQCRVLHDAEDSLIDGLIPAARQYAEEYTRRAFVTQTWEVYLPAFPSSGRIYLPKAPLITVDEVGYTDGNGAAQTVASFLTVKHPARPYVAPAYGAEWPIARDVEDAVRVRFTAGYGAADDVPRAIRQAILIGVEDLYQNRGRYTTGTIVAEIPTVRRLLAMYRLPTVP